MDPVTQGLLGAGMALSCSAKSNNKIKTIALLGALGGMSPDLDILFRSGHDPLFSLEYHRHFTHSMAFIPFGGLIVAGFLYLVFKNRASFKFVYIYTTLGYATHALLDACTSYGTRLLWPFSDLRISWNVISIIDPIYTVTLIIFLLLCIFRKSINYMRVGMILSLGYIAFGFIQYERVKSVVTDIAKDRGHAIERISLNPTFGNNILWRTVYQSAGKYYIDAVYMSLFGPHQMQEGLSVDVIDKNKVFPEIGQDSVQRNDIRRFAYFSQDYIYLHPDYKNVIADLRYGTLPYDAQSLWGIEVNPETPDAHIVYLNLRDINEANRTEFWEMLKGQPDKYNR